MPTFSLGMRQLNGMYTQYNNRRHGKVGHVFQGRYKSILVEEDHHLLELCRYIVLNPVKAKMTDHPGKWQWSSYHFTSTGKWDMGSGFQDVKLVIKGWLSSEIFTQS